MGAIMTELPKLLEPESLVELLERPDILLIDVCKDEIYSRRHIPGAVHVSTNELMNGGQPWPNKLPSPAQLDALFSRIGLTADKHVVVYDDEGGGWAGRLIWTLDVIGHQNWSYLNGGLIAWYAEGFPTTDEVPPPEVAEFEANVDRAAIVSAEDIMALDAINDVQIWDARSIEEYTGEKVMAEKGGHIPGAIHCEWTSLMDRERNMRIRQDALEYLTSVGISPDKPTITHCQSHHRSGFTYLVARLLGFSNIRAYDGSWWEWGNRSDTPVEQGR